MRDRWRSTSHIGIIRLAQAPGVWRTEGVVPAKGPEGSLAAAALLECLKARRPWEVEEGWADLLGRGAGWVTRAKQGLGALTKMAPELALEDWLRFPGARLAKRSGR